MAQWATRARTRPFFSSLICWVFRSPLPRPCGVAVAGHQIRRHDTTPGHNSIKKALCEASKNERGCWASYIYYMGLVNFSHFIGMHTRYHTSVVFGFGAAFGGINRDDSWYCYFNASECPSVIGLRTVSGRFCKHIAMRGFLYVQPRPRRPTPTTYCR